jgi:hypothetical protein
MALQPVPGQAQITSPNFMPAPSWVSWFNLVREAINNGGSSVSDTAYGASWDGVTTIAPSKNAIYDKIQSMGSGALVLLSTQTASASSTIDFTSSIDSTYKKYIVDFSNVVAGTDNTDIQMRFQQGGSFVTSSNYNNATITCSETGVGQTANGHANVSRQILCDFGLDSVNPTSGTVEFYQPDLSVRTMCNWRLAGTKSDDLFVMTYGAGCLELNAATTGVRFFMSSGTIATGTFKLYGVT